MSKKLLPSLPFKIKTISNITHEKSPPTSLACDPHPSKSKVLPMGGPILNPILKGINGCHFYFLNRQQMRKCNKIDTSI